MYVPADTGPVYEGLGCTWRFLVTSEQAGGSYTTMEIGVPPGVGPGLHVHDREEEQFYVLEGELTYRVGEETIRASVGDFIHIPRHTPHGFTCGETPARVLTTFGPGTGIDDDFKSVSAVSAADGPVHPASG
jgi:quercetin dioxygenase-like cupin family protein